MLKQHANSGVILMVLLAVGALWVLDPNDPQTLIVTVSAGGVVLLAIYDPVDDKLRPRLVDVALAVALIATPVVVWRIGDFSPSAAAAAGVAVIAVAAARFEHRRRSVRADLQMSRTQRATFLAWYSGHPRTVSFAQGAGWLEVRLRRGGCAGPEQALSRSTKIADELLENGGAKMIDDFFGLL